LKISKQMNDGLWRMEASTITGLFYSIYTAVLHYTRLISEWQQVGGSESCYLNVFYHSSGVLVNPDRV